MRTVAIIGTGFVADLYMRSLATFPSIRVVSAYDRNSDSLGRFCGYWGVSGADNLDEVLAAPRGAAHVVLNLTNPDSHYGVTKECLENGCHVYSEKPLAMRMDDALALQHLAQDKQLILASAPCSVLSQSAQTLWRALRGNLLGRPHLAYAELDDGFIAKAPYRKWISESGAPWPWRDEFATGCTLEHAGYYLTWLLAFFGPVQKVVAASARVATESMGPGSFAPDFSVAALFFESGVVARLTCSVVARHDHRLRIFCENGTFEVDDCWNNAAAVRVRRRRVIRRRLVEMPFTKRVKPPATSHPMVGRRGAAAMNFALGPAEVLQSIEEQRPCRLSADFALHLNEVALAIHNSQHASGECAMTTRFDAIEPMPWAT